jgi:RimJ/RimL family protein N-acetyltransferase
MPAARHPPYRIATERLVVRCWSPEDATRLNEALAESRDHLLPWLPWAAEEPRDVDSKVELLRVFRGRFDLGEDFTYAVLDPEETRVVGGSGLHTRAGAGAFEIGYWIRTAETRRGLATEVVAALTRIAFEAMDVDRVEIRVEPGNVPSLGVPAKLGFEREATLKRRHLGVGGKRCDLVVWSMFADAYPRSPCALAKLRAWDASGREMPALSARRTRRRKP